MYCACQILYLNIAKISKCNIPLTSSFVYRLEKNIISQHCIISLWKVLRKIKRQQLQLLIIRFKITAIYISKLIFLI